MWHSNYNDEIVITGLVIQLGKIAVTLSVYLNKTINFSWLSIF